MHAIIKFLVAKLKLSSHKKKKECRQRRRKHTKKNDRGKENFQENYYVKLLK
jgi:hypothetical protein